MDVKQENANSTENMSNSCQNGDGGGVETETKTSNTTSSTTHNTNSTSNSSSKKESNSSNSSRNRRDRNRSRRRSRSPPSSRSRDNRGHPRVSRRIYVANIPFDVRWGELKDLFREKIGNVRFCQLFENEEGKPRGCGLVEFDDHSSAKKALEVMNRFSFKGRELVVKEDLDMERDRYGRLILNSHRNERDDRRGSDHRDDRRRDVYNNDPHYSNRSDSGVNSSSGGPPYCTYGLSPQFLDSLGIKGPLNNKVFVANLDYKVTERKMEDIFALAGKVSKVRLYCDHEGKSKGFGVVEFEHPVEAVQAISMFNNQKLYDRILSVRLDRFDNEDQFNNDGLPAKLPRGLEGIGKGLGIGGQPLNINKTALANNVNPMGPSPIGPVTPGINIAAQPLATPTVTPQAATAALNVLTNLAGGLQNLPTLTQSFAQFTNTTAAPAASNGIPTAVAPGVSAPSSYPSSNDLSNSSSTLAPNTSQYSTTGYSTGTMADASVTNSTYPTTGQIMGASSYPLSQPVAQTQPNIANNPSIPYGNSATGSAPTNTGPISSYSTYDQRNYRDDQYRNHGIDTIFIRNLPSTFSWQNLRDRFHEIGEIRYAETKGHGTALIRFSSDRDAQRAVDLMNGIRIENRAIEVSLYY
ncbi:Myelin expression factor 2 [Sarcoptes scabiei]|uniref:Myelin expression factor 2 n=1 Tax=Sarcoptes scabiei TaxID=52283 RepID=A0A132AC23_SARSC|nr:Myelin expression factor 2 [Sarcoptes scabiei]KPM07990.1 myelin expression factor 2-like protein [Sarcoptes scabiei]